MAPPPGSGDMTGSSPPLRGLHCHNGEEEGAPDAASCPSCGIGGFLWGLGQAWCVGKLGVEVGFVLGGGLGDDAKR